MSFKDHFSAHAAAYAQFRPQYPRALFAYLATLTAAHGVAWDAATGNGQAATQLADFYAHVIATDASAEQIEHATPHPQITYATMPSEQTDIPAHSVDLITVAQALHWFDAPKFFAEAQRVAKPGGVLAVWFYGSRSTITPAIDPVIHTFYWETINAFWPEERRHIDDDYARIPLPCAPLATSEFVLEVEWTLGQFLGYLSTWSSVKIYEQRCGTSPMTALEPLLLAAWGDPKMVRLIRWPLTVRVGRFA